MTEFNENDYMAVLLSLPKDGTFVLRADVCRSAEMTEDEANACLDALEGRGLAEWGPPLMFRWRRTAKGMEIKDEAKEG